MFHIVGKYNTQYIFTLLNMKTRYRIGVDFGIGSALSYSNLIIRLFSPYYQINPAVFNFVVRVNNDIVNSLPIDHLCK